MGVSGSRASHAVCQPPSLYYLAQMGCLRCHNHVCGLWTPLPSESSALCVLTLSLSASHWQDGPGPAPGMGPPFCPHSTHPLCGRNSLRFQAHQFLGLRAWAPTADHSHRQASKQICFCSFIHLFIHSFPHLFRHRPRSSRYQINKELTVKGRVSQTWVYVRIT